MKRATQTVLNNRSTTTYNTHSAIKRLIPFAQFNYSNKMKSEQQDRKYFLSLRVNQKTNRQQ